MTITRRLLGARPGAPRSRRTAKTARRYVR
jgi:hypothetical protein